MPSDRNDVPRDGADPRLNPSTADPRVGTPKHHAAGPRAVQVALTRNIRAAGVIDTARTLLAVNQFDGFDCPGCAWPERRQRKTAEFCENGAKAIADETTRDRADRTFFSSYPIAELDGADDYWLGQRGRLTEPMIRKPGSLHFEPIGWDEAFAMTAGNLKTLASPDQAVFYTSGRTGNEAAFCYQLMARAFGTNNLPDCSNMCHETTSVALSSTIGIGKGTVTFADFDNADLILVVGQNPGTNHPRMLTALEDAKRRGAKIVAVNPLPEAGLVRFRNPQRLSGIAGAGTKMADLFCQIRLNGDLSLFQLLNKWLIEQDLIDHEFVRRYTENFDALRAHLDTLVDDVLLDDTGLESTGVDDLFRLVAGSERIVICWAMGVTQHRNAVETTREIVNFALLRGLIGRLGAGLCPVRGHSNVQGDRTMGIWENPEPGFMERLAERFQFDPPPNRGHDVVAALQAVRRGDVRFMMSLGGNLARALPDTGVSELALRSCEFAVHVATKLNRSHVIAGRTSLILPTLGRTEVDRTAGVRQHITVEDSFGFVHASTGVLKPAGEDLRSEVAIVCSIAELTVPDVGSIPWSSFKGDYTAIREAVGVTVDGFEGFNRRLAERGGFPLANGPRDERRFPTATGFAVFSVNEPGIQRAPADGLLLQTLRSHDQYNTTIYGLSDRYRGIEGGRLVVFVNPFDIEALGLTDGGSVDIVSLDGLRRAGGFRVVAYPVARGSAAGYFPELNVLVGIDELDRHSRTPAFKSIGVRFEPAA